MLNTNVSSKIYFNIPNNKNKTRWIKIMFRNQRKKYMTYHVILHCEHRFSAWLTTPQTAQTGCSSIWGVTIVGKTGGGGGREATVFSWRSTMDCAI